MSLSNPLAFPSDAPTVQLTLIAATSVRVETPSSEGVISVYNSHTAAVFVKTGDVTVNATLTTSVPVPPGAIRNFRVPAEHTHIAVISAAGTPVITISSGLGGTSV